MPPPAQTQALPEVEVLRIKVAHLEYQVAQLHLQQLGVHRETLIRATLLPYVGEQDIDHYVIDLEAGTVRRREEIPVWNQEP